MRAASLAGQVVAVLSRRTPALQAAPGDPVTFPGRVSRLFAGSERTGGEIWSSGASSPYRPETYGEDIIEIPPRRGRWSSASMDLPSGFAGWSSPRRHLPEFRVLSFARRYRAPLVTAAAAAVVIALAALLVAYPRSPGSGTSSQIPPLRPTGLAVQNSTADSLRIVWSGPAAGPAPDDYEVLRNGTKIATIPGTVTSYTDQGLAANTAYSYQVVAITGPERSHASATLSVFTAKPSLSDAVLSYAGAVTEKMLTVTPAAPGWTFKLGQTKTDSWVMTPDCVSGPCTVTLDGAYNGYTYSAMLTRSGATYTGTTTLKDYFYCINSANTFSATLNISITVSNATTQKNVWTATAFTGHETVNAPAYMYAPTNQTCFATVGQLSVASSG